MKKTFILIKFLIKLKLFNILIILMSKHAKNYKKTEKIHLTILTQTLIMFNNKDTQLTHL